MYIIIVHIKHFTYVQNSKLILYKNSFKGKINIFVSMFLMLDWHYKRFTNNLILANFIFLKQIL